jgi:hypothetical protein
MANSDSTAVVLPFRPKAKPAPPSVTRTVSYGVARRRLKRAVAAATANAVVNVLETTHESVRQNGLGSMSVLTLSRIVAEAFARNAPGLAVTVRPSGARHRPSCGPAGDRDV